MSGEDDDDPCRAARGIFNAMLMSAAFWMLVGATCWGIWG